MIALLRKAIAQFSEDDCATLAASLSYYTLFAMPPLLFLLVTVVSWGMSTFYEQERAEAEAQKLLEQQAAQLIGIEAAGKEIGAIIERSKHQPGQWWKNLLSLAGVLIGATGLMTSLQASLNRVWRVRPKEGKAARRFLIKRLTSLAMILGFGFLLLVSFLVGTVLSILGNYAAERLGMAGMVSLVVNESVSFLTTCAFFAAILCFMPDAQVPWKHALLGGLLTVILFTCGRTVLFYYLSNSNPGDQLGSAAGSLIVIIVWVYYSSMILLFGAEVTANMHRGRPDPEEGAVAVAEYVTVDGDQ